MASNVLMPKMGYDMTQGRILRWIKREGDPVQKGEAIAEIQTEKVNIEIEAFESGVLAKILHQEGEDVPVGAPIAIVAAPGEAVTLPVAPAAAPATEYPTPPEAPLPPLEAMPAERAKASPLARRIAVERGVDLTQLRGSGPGGRIVQRDVEEAAAGKPPVTAPTRVPVGAGERKVPLSRMRQTIARRLSESKISAPHFYLTKAIDMTAAVALRAQLNEALDEAEQVSFNDMIIRAVVLACSRFPQVNASWSDEAIIEHGAIHIGVAVAMPEGLLVPVLQDARDRSLVELARQTKAMIARAKANKLKPEELGGGTITVSNLGAYDVEIFTAILNPPEAAILAVGTLRREPVVGEDDQIQIRTMMRLTMSSDHRMIDGATAAQFLGEVKRLLQTPILLLL